MDPITRMREIREAGEVKTIYLVATESYVFECQLCRHRTGGLVGMHAHFEAAHAVEWNGQPVGQGVLM